MRIREVSFARRLSVPMVQLALSLAIAGVAHADVVQAVQECRDKADLLALRQSIRLNYSADATLAFELAHFLDGGSRWFDRGGAHGDPIDAVTSDGPRVDFTYRRDGTRWGRCELTAHWVGEYAVLEGDWYQQSKKHDASTSIPKLGSIHWGGLFADDHGGVIYVFAKTADGFRSVDGTGLDFGDNATLRNWLTGRNRPLVYGGVPTSILWEPRPRLAN